MSTPIDFKHPHYTKRLPEYTKISDVLQGESMVKSKTTEYLPMFNPYDQSQENLARYNHFLQGAVFSNYTGRTLSNLVGQAFATIPNTTLPPQLEILLDDIDGEGVSADQQAKQALANVIAYSRAGLLVDYPTGNAPATIAEVESGEIRPTIMLYDPKSIINWRTVRVGGKTKLSLVVIEESIETTEDGISIKYQKQWRLLRLIDESYTVELYRRDKSGNFTMVEKHIPLNGAGQPFSEIPFTFIGAAENDSADEKPVLLDICDLNLAHYRNSAVYEEIVTMLGAPTPVFSNLDSNWVKEMMPEGIQLGSRSAVLLPEGGNASLLTVPEYTLPQNAMAQKVEQMHQLGAMIVEKTNVPITATESRIRSASDLSILSAIVTNVSEAYTRAFKWCGQFLNVDNDDISYRLNKDFTYSRITAEERRALREDYAAGLITWSEMREKLRDAGIATVDDEEAKDIIAGEQDQLEN